MLEWVAYEEDSEGRRMEGRLLVTTNENIEAEVICWDCNGEKAEFMISDSLIVYIDEVPPLIQLRTISDECQLCIYMTTLSEAYEFKFEVDRLAHPASVTPKTYLSLSQLVTKDMVIELLKDADAVRNLSELLPPELQNSEILSKVLASSRMQNVADELSQAIYDNRALPLMTALEIKVYNNHHITDPMLLFLTALEKN